MDKKGDLLINILGWLTLIVVIVALYAVFIYVPTEKEMGIVQRIFYFHVPSAWVAFLAFFIVFVASILYLWRRGRKWDILASSSAEVGVIFCSLVLITGAIWAKPIWNTWWTWEPRLTTATVLWLIYIVYLMLRSFAGEEERGARYAAVLGIVGFIDVPIVFMSIRWWRTIHPVVFKVGSIGLTSSMLKTLLICLIAFTLLYLYLLLQRVSLERMRDEVEILQGKLRRF